MGKRTALYDSHVESGARIVDFGGWDMPLHYGSQLEEHHRVRTGAGMFDVSHMRVVDIEGSDAGAFLERVLGNDINKAKAPGKAIYGCLLNESGGILDDLISYFLDENQYRLVVNAATAEKDLAWLNKQASDFDVDIRARDDLAIIAVQGPEARERVLGLMENEAERERVRDLKRFSATQAGDWFIARTGYTGEDGFEIVLPGGQAAGLWKKLNDAGVIPAGLGARDTLRLEAGLNLYGQDMDESVTPLESNLAWTVAMEPITRDFIGRDALVERKNESAGQKLVGLVLEDQGILRHGMRVLVEGNGEGVITSGGFSPTLKRSIALARVPAAIGDTCTVEVRGKPLKARVVSPPFVRAGRAAKGIA